MPINIATDRLAVLEAMVRKEQELQNAATAQNPLAGRTAADMSPERLREVERLVAEQIAKQRRGEVGRPTVQRVPGAIGKATPTSEGRIVQESFDIQQDIEGNYWNRKQDFAGGPVIIERLKADYSPADQRRVEQLYRTRSEIVTDSDLDRDEQARQNALDDVDFQIGRIPKLPPIMRQPSPQEQFEATIVETPDGQKGYFDGKKFTAFNEAKSEENYRELRTKAYERMMKEEAEEAGRKDPKKPRSTALIHRLAKLEADILTNKVQMPEPGQGFTPNLNKEWSISLENLKPFWGKANEAQMLSELESYKLRAKALGISAEVATADFLMRWKEAAEGESIGQDIVAKMSDEKKKEADYAFLDTIQPTATQSQPTNETMLATGTVEIKNKKGEVFLLPANELPEALKSGYTLVER